MLKSMRLFKRGKIWYVELARGKKRSLQTTDKSEALKAFTKIKKAAILNKLIEYDKTISLGNFIEKYLEYSENFLSDNTTRITANSFKCLLKTIDKKTPLNQISQTEIQNFIQIRLREGISKTTVNIDIRHLKAAFNRAVEWGYIKNQNPFKNIKPLKITKKSPNFLKIEDINKVRNVIESPQWKYLFDFYIYTGARRSEVLSLEWNDIVLQNKIIIFRKTKEGKIRKIPICKQLESTIKEMKENGIKSKIGKIFYGFNAKYVSKKFSHYLKKAGFEGYRLHDLRHTFASLLIMQGIDLTTVKELLGHSDIAVTQIYTHLTTKHLENAISKIDW